MTKTVILICVLLLIAFFLFIGVDTVHEQMKIEKECTKTNLVILDQSNIRRPVWDCGDKR